MAIVPPKPTRASLKRGPMRLAQIAPPMSPPKCPKLSRWEPGESPMAMLSAHVRTSAPSVSSTLWKPCTSSTGLFVARKTPQPPMREQVARDAGDKVEECESARAKEELDSGANAVERDAIDEKVRRASMQEARRDQSVVLALRKGEVPLGQGSHHALSRMEGSKGRDVAYQHRVSDGMVELRAVNGRRRRPAPRCWPALRPGARSKEQHECRARKEAHRPRAPAEPHVQKLFHVKGRASSVMGGA
eukprot:scaffold59730_cov30-Tisochrysis_lutea.AAC.2